MNVIFLLCGVHQSPLWSWGLCLSLLPISTCVCPGVCVSVCKPCQPCICVCVCVCVCPQLSLPIPLPSSCSQYFSHPLPTFLALHLSLSLSLSFLLLTPHVSPSFFLSPVSLSFSLSPTLSVYLSPVLASGVLLCSALHSPGCEVVNISLTHFFQQR